MPDLKIVGIITSLVIIEAMQALALIAHVYSFVSIPVVPPVLPGLEPERESFLYEVFLLTIAVLTIGLTAFLYKKLSVDTFRQKCYRFIIVEAVWLLLMLFVFFKWITYRYPFYNILPVENGNWVLSFFYVVAGCSLLSKIFWPEIEKKITPFLMWLDHWALPKRAEALVYVSVFVAIVLLLYPHLSLTAQMIAQWSKFEKWQNFPFTHFLIQRGFSMGSIVAVLFYCNAVLVFTLFIVTYKYLKSFLLAILVTLLVVKTTFFHYGMSPVCWNDPQATLINLSPNFYFYKDPNHLPMFAALRVRQFFSFFMGYGIAIFYVFTLLNAWGKEKIATVLSIFGLVMYTRYIGQPDVFAYGAVCWPAIVLLCFWLKQISEAFFPKYAKRVFVALIAVALLMILTNRVFVTYPHFWIHYAQS